MDRDYRELQSVFSAARSTEEAFSYMDAMSDRRGAEFGWHVIRAAASEHAEATGEPEMEIGDLEEALLAALRRLSPRQRREWLREMVGTNTQLEGDAEMVGADTFSREKKRVAFLEKVAGPLPDYDEENERRPCAVISTDVSVRVPVGTRFNEDGDLTLPDGRTVNVEPRVIVGDGNGALIVEYADMNAPVMIENIHYPTPEFPAEPVY